MRLPNTTARYGALPMSMHWLMLLLLVGIYICADLRGLLPKGEPLRDVMKTWHYMLGLTVFGLVWLRLTIRAFSTTPAITPAPVRWQALAATVMHYALYVLMISAPLLGWLTLSAQGKPIPFFGYELPALIGADKALARTIKDVHETLGTTGYFLIGTHALAALFHHYVIRDNTLTRMLPWRTPTKQGN